MRPGLFDMRGVYLAAFLLLALDGLVVWRGVHRLVLHEGTVSPDAPLFLLFLLALQILLLLLFFQLRDLLAYQRRLRETAEMQLELSNQVFNSLDLAVTVLNENGCYVFVNQAAAELLGLPAPQLLGRRAMDFVTEQVEHSGAPVEVPQAPEASGAATFVLENRDRRYYATLLRADGQTVRVLVRVVPRWHAGRMVGNIATVIPAAVPVVAARSWADQAERQS